MNGLIVWSFYYYFYKAMMTKKLFTLNIKCNINEYKYGLVSLNTVILQFFFGMSSSK